MIWTYEDPLSLEHIAVQKVSYLCHMCSDCEFVFLALTFSTSIFLLFQFLTILLMLRPFRSLQEGVIQVIHSDT